MFRALKSIPASVPSSWRMWPARFTCKIKTALLRRPANSPKLPAGGHAYIVWSDTASPSARRQLSCLREDVAKPRSGSDFPLTLQGPFAGDDVNGTIGGGRCEMSLVDQNASIEILNQ